MNDGRAQSARTSRRSRRTEVLGDVTPDPCPVCSTPNSPTDRFCEGCGADIDAVRAAPPITTWTIEAAPDRAYYGRVAPPHLRFPAERHPVDYTLGPDPITVGRTRAGQPTSPEIDLSGDLADPGVSTRHATIELTPDGPQIVDLGSTNGTTLNGSSQPIAPSQRVTLADGDRIHVGAWTTLTIHARRSPR